MKKSVIALLVTLLTGSLMGCQTRDAAISAPSAEMKTQTWQGVIPCADCEGIQITLSLQQGGRYVMNERYLGSDGVEATQQGRWTRTAEKLLLVSDKDEKRYFRPRGNELEMMDTEGNPIQSTNNYRLEFVNPDN